MDEPHAVWPWDAEQSVRARELIEWARPVPGFEWGAPYSFSSASNPSLVASKLIGVAGNPGFVFAADPENGEILWRHEIGSLLLDHFVFDEEFVYVGVPTSIRALRIADGALTWEFIPEECAGDAIYSRPFLSGDSLFVVTREGALYHLRRKDGEVLWRTVVDPKANANASPCVAGEWVWTGTNSGLVAACDLVDGRQVAHSHLKGSVKQAIQSFADGLLAYTSSEIVYLSLAGKRIGNWSPPQGEEVRHCLATDQGLLVRLASIQMDDTRSDPPLGYYPERLILLNAAFRERWSLTYPPHSTGHMLYDSERGLAIEATPSGLGFVDVEQGVRTHVVYGFPCRFPLPDLGIFPPALVGNALFGLTTQGTLLKMRLPI